MLLREFPDSDRKGLLSLAREDAVARAHACLSLKLQEQAVRLDAPSLGSLFEGSAQRADMVARPFAFSTLVMCVFKEFVFM